VTKNATGHTVGGRHMEIVPPLEACLAMFRPDTMDIATEEGPRTLPMELVEISSIAGRTMATALSGELRLTAILDRPPMARVGDHMHLVLPERPAAWFTLTGERIA
jgi:iron(III) transport system ATP-binding protein